MRFTLKQLEIFIAVAQKGSVSSAAEILCLTQSACSMALSTLENQLNGGLFDRYGKRLILNERGKVLFPKALQLVEQAQEIETSLIKTDKYSLTGNLTVGASSTAGNYFLPEIVGNFKNDYPSVKISLRVTNTKQVIEQLLHFDIDLGIVEGRCYHEEIHTFSWKTDELIVVSAPQNSLSNKQTLSLDDLYQAKWIVREYGSGTRERFDEITQGKILPFLELGHTEAIKQAVRAGFGISCLSRVVVADALKSKDLIQLPTVLPKIMRNFYILIHKKKYRTEVLKKWLEYVISQGNAETEY